MPFGIVKTFPNFLFPFENERNCSLLLLLPLDKTNKLHYNLKIYYMLCSKASVAWI